MQASGAPAHEADAGDELRLDRDDLVQLAGAIDGSSAAAYLAAAPGSVTRRARPVTMTDQPVRLRRVELVGLVADDGALRLVRPAVGLPRAGRDRRAEVRPDDDGPPVDQVVDRPDGRHGALREHDPADGDGREQLPALARRSARSLAVGRADRAAGSRRSAVTAGSLWRRPCARRDVPMVRVHADADGQGPKVPVQAMVPAAGAECRSSHTKIVLSVMCRM